MAMKSEIETALQAHAAWRDKFKDILNGRASFNLETISAADQCFLGKWLANEGHRMIPSELHDDICILHNEFHHHAADIIQKIKDKKYAEAKVAISLDGIFNQTSLRLREKLAKLSFKEPAAASSPSLQDDQAPSQPGSEETLTPLNPDDSTDD